MPVRGLPRASPPKSFPKFSSWCLAEPHISHGCLQVRPDAPVPEGTLAGRLLSEQPCRGVPCLQAPGQPGFLPKTCMVQTCRRWSFPAGWLADTPRAGIRRESQQRGVGRAKERVRGEPQRGGLPRPVGEGGACSLL